MCVLARESGEQTEQRGKRHFILNTSIMPTRERNTKRKVREIEEVLRASLLVNSMSDADENDVGSDDVDELFTTPSRAWRT